jgi:hypothetical protein
MRFQLNNQVEVAIAALNANTAGAIQYSYLGEPVLSRSRIREVSETLERCHGAFGHIIGQATSPIDLHAAMRSPQMQKFSPVMVEGEEFLRDGYDPKIPKGART